MWPRSGFYLAQMGAVTLTSNRLKLVTDVISHTCPDYDRFCKIYSSRNVVSVGMIVMV